jgi:hypothetical protein
MKNRAQLAQELFELKFDGGAGDNWRKINAVISHLSRKEAQAVLELASTMRRERLGEPEYVDFERMNLATLAELAELCSPAHQFDHALLHAAYEAHPDWLFGEYYGYDGYFFVGKGKEQESATLIEWYKTTYPEQATAIKAGINWQD